MALGWLSSCRPLASLPVGCLHHLSFLLGWMIHTHVSLHQWMMRYGRLRTLVPWHLAYPDITVPSRSINLIRAEFGGRFDCQPCTMFEAVCAVLWQCRTRAIMSNSETPAVLMFSANVRKHVGAKPGYYGNCSSCQFLMAPSGTVASADILDLVKMIKHGKEDIPHTSILK